jgi:hypothetical protein
VQKADEEAAKVYEEFVESFKGDDAPGSEGGVKAFVRGGVVAPGSRSHDATGTCWRNVASCVSGYQPVYLSTATGAGSSMQQLAAHLAGAHRSTVHSVATQGPCIAVRT